MKEDVERALRLGGAPPGYVIRNLDGSLGAEVEYPDSDETVAALAEQPDPWTRSPGSELDECDSLLQFAGYHTEFVLGPQRHRLLVRPRA